MADVAFTADPAGLRTLSRTSGCSAFPVDREAAHAMSRGWRRRPDAGPLRSSGGVKRRPVVVGIVMDEASDPEARLYTWVYEKAPKLLLPTNVTVNRLEETSAVASSTALNAFVAGALGSDEPVSSRLADRVLLLGNPSKHTRRRESVLGGQKRRRLKPSRQRRQVQPLTARERRRLGLYKLDKRIPYAEVQPLAQLWLEYAQSMIPVQQLDRLRQQEREAVLDRLLRLDWHGASITVHQSAAPERVGVHGIVIQETEQTFKIVSPDSRLRVLPKLSTVFTVDLSDDWVLVLCGDALRVRSAERSVRKPKRKALLLV